MKRLLLVYVVLLFAYAVQAQDRVVTGKVTSSEDGSPIPGANVVLKGTSNGTVTDSNGGYKLNVPTAGGTLVISFIGMQTVEAVIGERSVIDMGLASDVKQLSEVVVTGTGVATDRKRLAISVESVTADRLPVIPNASIDQALIGKIAGAQINSVSGSPGAPVSIQLRGINTLSGGTSPLIMVDGVQLAATSLNQLDLSNVERIEVVQGASAATIYGAQGANGVIQVFTKKGQSGQMRIDISARMSSDQLINNGDLHQPLKHSFITNGSGTIVDTGGNPFAQIQAGIWPNTTWQNGPTAKNDKVYGPTTPYYDHVAQLFSSAKTSNFNLSMSGGKDKSDYNVTISKLKQESIIQGALDRANLTANVGFEIAKGLKLRSITQLVYSDNTTNPFSSGGAYISSAMYTYPFADFNQKDADGNYVYKFGGAGVNNSSPNYAKQFQTFSNKTIDIIQNLNLHYTVNKFLELDYKVGVNFQNGSFSRDTQNQKSTTSYAYFGEGLTNPDGQFAKAFTTQYNINSLASAIVKFDFDKDVKLNLPIQSTTQISFDWRRNQFNRNYETYNILPSYSPIDKVNGSQAGSNSASEWEDEYITYGFLVNQHFDYKDIAGISGGFRTDYASTFGQAKTPFTFPRGDVYVNIAKLDFWSGLYSFMPEFKLRAAYGEAGIQPVAYNGDVMGSVPNHYLRYNLLQVGVLGGGSSFNTFPTSSNPLIQVERTKEFEFGVDLGFAPIKSGPWLNFINGGVSIWDRSSTGVVWAKTVAVSAGAAQQWDNYVSLSSAGVQFNVNMDMYTSSNFNWDMNVNYGHQLSKVDATSDGKSIPLSYGSAATYTLTPGEAIGSVLGYKALTDINQKDKNGNFYLTNSTTAPVAANYTYVDGRVVDIATKQVKFTGDKYALGNTTPTFIMNFTNTFNYKDFLTFSFQIDWVYGQKTYNQTKEWMYSEGLHKDYDKPVTIAGETAPFTAYYKSFYDASESNGTKDFFLENSSYARLRNLSVGFDFAKFFKIQKMQRLQLVLSGRNLATITNYTGFDPEANQNTAQGGTTSTTPQNATQRGLDFWSFPNFKSYQVALNLSF